MSKGYNGPDMGIFEGYGECDVDPVPGVYSPEQIAAHVDKVIASDGVDDSRAVEAMARAMEGAIPDEVWDWSPCYVEGETLAPLFGYVNLHALARAALGALRALKGE